MLAYGWSSPTDCNEMSTTGAGHHIHLNERSFFLPALERPPQEKTGAQRAALKKTLTATENETERSAAPDRRLEFRASPKLTCAGNPPTNGVVLRLQPACNAHYHGPPYYTGAAPQDTHRARPSHG